MSELIVEDGLTVARAWHADCSELAGANIAISGASGLLGKYLVSVLLGLAQVHDLPLKVIAIGRDVDKLAAALDAWHGDKRLELVAADVSTGDLWPTAATHLIHAGSPATPKGFVENPVGVIKANVLGTLGAIEQARLHGSYICLVSTMEIYGTIPNLDVQSDHEISENVLGLVDPLDIRSAYPESKRLAENLIIAGGAQFGVRGDIARVSHTYGPGTSPDDNRVQVDFVKQAVSGETIELKSDGFLRRHYTYAADSASAIVHILASQGNRSAPEAFNVADSDARISIRQLAELALQAAGRSSDELIVNTTLNPNQSWSKMPGATFLDTSKLRALGWRPLFTLPTGLSRMARYISSQVL